MIIKTYDGSEIELKTGDELLCSGTGPLSKLIITYNRLMGVKGEAMQMSHVAKFIRGEVFEATTLNAWCNKKGFQSNPYLSWIQYYTGRVWVRKTQDCGIDESAYYNAAYAMLGTPYESGIPGLLELTLTSLATKIPGLKDWARKHLETKELHCSEINVKLAQAGGYYDLCIRPNKMPPYTFWNGGRYERGFFKGRLLPAMRIK